MVDIKLRIVSSLNMKECIKELERLQKQTYMTVQDCNRASFIFARIGSLRLQEENKKD
jgi:hypothetical protein